MLRELPPRTVRDRLPIGTKSLSLDPDWSDPSTTDIETSLLRTAAFPEVGRQAGLTHEFVILGSLTSAETPGHEDLLTRIETVAGRTGIATVVIGREHDQPGWSAVRHSAHDLDRLDDRAFAKAFAALRERVRGALDASRSSARRHVFVPLCDAAVLAAVVDLLAQTPASERPVIHLATRWSAAEIPNARRFGPLRRFGQAIHQLNAERPTTFVYAWARSLARQLSGELGIKVAAIDPPPELSLASDGEIEPARFTVGYFGSAGEGSGIERIAGIVRAANRTPRASGRTRFIVQLKPDRPDGTHSPRLRQHIADLSAIAGGNVTIVEEALPRPAFFDALKAIDALLLPCAGNPGVERISTTASHAMAAGKLVATFDDVAIAGVPRSRLLTGRDERALGEVISDAATDLGTVRQAARKAKSAYWAARRPSRLFAQLLYGPMVIANADGTGLA